MVACRLKLRYSSWETLTLHLLSLADLGGETSLNCGDTASRAAVVACDKVETILTLAEFGVGRLARLAGHVLDCVAGQ